MGKLVFIIGGARSGKSRCALNVAEKFSDSVVYIATCDTKDEEMAERIRRHQKVRPRHWKTMEVAKDISAALKNAEEQYSVALVDCVGLWVSNLLGDALEDETIEERIREFVSTIRGLKSTVIVVSNEVGCAIVPANPLARRFRDLLGIANQIIAEKANEVILMQSGIPITIKGGTSHGSIA